MVFLYTHSFTGLTKPFQFYRSLLMWPQDFHLSALLDEYASPKPEVAGFVRHQMLHNRESMDIDQAVDDQLEGESRKTGYYTRWLLHSGLDFDNPGPSLTEAITGGLVYRALFDLMLGQRVKTYQLDRYREVYAARVLVEGVFDECGEDISPDFSIYYIWWEGAISPILPREPWVSPRFRDHPGFLKAFETWLEDGRRLQDWLEDFSAKTVLVNNPEATTDRVFSETVAIEVLKWAKVGHLMTRLQVHT